MRCEAILHLHRKGVPVREIARQTKTARNTVRRWVRAGAFAPYCRAPGPSLLDQHLGVVEERWRQGRRNCAALHRELCALGFEGGYGVVRRWAVRREQGAPAQPPSYRVPSMRRVARLLTRDPAALSVEDSRFIEALYAAAPRVRAAAKHVRAFADLLRRREPDKLEPWLDAAATTGLQGFAAGLRQDEAAVRAAIAEPWSNGPVEGQVNRLKLIKRSMYGRAKFDLLRQRILYIA